MKTTPPSSDPKIIVSACLLGHNVRYDGGNKFNQAVQDFLHSIPEAAIITVCPESASGMPSPRPAQEFRGGAGKDVLQGKASVINENGKDVTSEFIRGSGERSARQNWQVSQRRRS